MPAVIVEMRAGGTIEQKRQLVEGKTPAGLPCLTAVGYNKRY